MLVKILFLAFLFYSMNVTSQKSQYQKKNNSIDKVQALKDTLSEMMKQTDNKLFINHCKSFIQVIDAQDKLTINDSSLLSAAYDTFCNTTSLANCRKIESYLNRQWSLIFSWCSPTDGTISMAWLTLPKDWDPQKTYPLYVHLHGLSSNYGLPINFLTRFYLKGISTTYAYEDGYWLSPWGRGNLWYQGISETDVWESKAELEQLVNIDIKRQYLTGHSMGGYGSWYIASHSAGTWAALGVEAGALWYGNDGLLKDEVVQQLKDLPTYFVCGNNDGLLEVDTRAYNLLNAAGNKNTKFVTFAGAHEHLYENDENMYQWMKDFVNDDYYTSINNTVVNENDELQCYPNPFSYSTIIRFILEKPGLVHVSIYNSEGKLIENLTNQILSKGIHEVKYRSTNLLPGIYFCRLGIEGKQFQHKILIKVK
jgi:hypothetical protein